MKPIYLFTGKNKYQIEQEIQKIIDKSKVDELSLAKYNCDEVPVDEAIYDCMTLSFFENTKVVIINEPLFLTSERSKVDHNIDLFLTYIKNPNENSVCIINAADLSLDKRKKVTKELMKVAEVKNYDNFSDADARLFIEREFHQQNKKITHEALNEFIVRTGGDAQAIHMELDKLFFFLQTKDEMTLEDIQLLVAEPLEHNIFNLTNEIIEGNVQGAIKTYHKLKRQNEEPLVFSSVLAKNFHLMYIIKYYQNKGYSEFQLRNILKIHPFQLKKLYQITRRTSEQIISDNILRLADYDLQVKTGKIDKYLGFELFILQQ